jgi:hypothetical protein
MFGACQWLPDKPAADAASVEADAGRAVDTAGAGGELAAVAGIAPLAGRKSGPFCPQPASSAAPHSNSKAEITMRRRMQAIRGWRVAGEYKATLWNRSVARDYDAKPVNDPPWAVGSVARHLARSAGDDLQPKSCAKRR